MSRTVRFGVVSYAESSDDEKDSGEADGGGRRKKGRRKGKGKAAAKADSGGAQLCGGTSCRWSAAFRPAAKRPCQLLSRALLYIWVGLLAALFTCLLPSCSWLPPGMAWCCRAGGSDYEMSEEEEEGAAEESDVDLEEEEEEHVCQRCRRRSDTCIASAATGEPLGER